MTALPKEREKCMKQTVSRTLTRNTGEAAYPSEKGTHPVDICNDSPEKISSSGIYKSIMTIFGIFLLISLIYTIGSLCIAMITAIDSCSEKTRRYFALVFTSIIACLILLYCFCRELYDALCYTAATRLIRVFNPITSWHDNGARCLATFLRAMQLAVMMVFLKWSLVTLIFGAEKSANLMKPWKSDGLNDTLERDQWNQTRKLDLLIFNECWHSMGNLIMLFVGMMIGGVCFGDHKDQSTSKLKRPSPLWWAFSRIYGEGAINMTAHFTFYYGIFVATASIFVALSGWVTIEYIQSLNWFKSFMLFTIPSYLIFLMICMALELIAYCTHSDKKRAGHSPFPSQASASRMMEATHGSS